MQSKQELEESYKHGDAWDYRTNPEDYKRREYILGIINTFIKDSQRAIDICCGSCFITEFIPSKEIHGIEIADNAAKLFPNNVKRVFEPQGKYDLVVSTGCLYTQYDWKSIVKKVNDAADNKAIIVLSNIEAWEVPEAIKSIKGKQLFEARFPYREYHQKVRVFRA